MHTLLNGALLLLDDGDILFSNQTTVGLCIHTMQGPLVLCLVLVIGRQRGDSPVIITYDTVFYHDWLRLFMHC